MCIVNLVQVINYSITLEYWSFFQVFGDKFITSLENERSVGNVLKSTKEESVSLRILSWRASLGMLDLGETLFEKTSCLTVVHPLSVVLPNNLLSERYSTFSGS
jgi:hypothetical protein